MRKTTTITLSGLSSYGNSVKELKEVLDGITDENATFDLSYSAGDRPWDGAEFTMTIDREP